MKRKSLFLLLFLFVCSSGLLRADLDVSIPPGTPLDWSFRRTIVLSGDDDYEKPKAVNDTGTYEDYLKQLQSVAEAAMANKPIDPWAESGILTRDLFGELDWTGSQTTGEAGSIQYSPVQETYKPELTGVMRFTMIGSFARVLLYGRSKVSPQEAAYQLIEVGQPALFAARAAKGASDVNRGNIASDAQLTQDVARYVLAAVGDAAGPPPNPVAGKNEFETLVNRLISYELGGGYAYDYDPNFARGLRLLGREALPALLDAAKRHPHKLIRRNAVAMIAAYSDAVVTETLLELCADDDAVVSTRAVMAVVKRKAPGGPAMVRKLMKASRNFYQQSFLVWALGGLSDPDSVPMVLTWARKGLVGADANTARDILWSALPALVRLRADGADAAEVYRLAVKNYEDPLDPLRQIAMLGLAAAGTPNELKAVQEFVTKRSLSGFAPSAMGVLVDALLYLDEKIDPRQSLLKKICLDRSFTDVLRFQVMGMYPFNKSDAPWLTREASMANAGPAGAIALFRLWSLDNEKAREIARAELANLSARDASRALFALRILGRGGDLGAQDLITAWASLDKKPPVAPQVDNKQLQAKVESIFRPFPALEALFMEMGRLRDPALIPTLKEHLASRDHAARPLAARAMGVIGGRDAADYLITLLTDEEDPWVRYFADEGLRRISRRDSNIDWVFGGKGEIQRGRKEWEEWASARPADAAPPKKETSEEDRLRQAALVLLVEIAEVPPKPGTNAAPPQVKINVTRCLKGEYPLGERDALWMPPLVGPDESELYWASQLLAPPRPGEAFFVAFGTPPAEGATLRLPHALRYAFTAEKDAWLRSLFGEAVAVAPEAEPEEPKPAPEQPKPGNGRPIAKKPPVAEPPKSPEEAMEDALAAKPDARSFTVKGISDGRALLKLQNLTNLNTLYITDTKLTDADMEQLALLPGLASLTFSGNPNITGDCFGVLKDLPKLYSLTLMKNGIQLGAGGLKALAQLEHMTVLHLNGVQCTDNALADVGGIKTLVQLTLKGMDEITPRGLKGLRGLKTLNALTIDDCEKFDDGLWEQLKLPSVRQLTIVKLDVTGKGLASVVGDLSELMHLSVRDCPGLLSRGVIRFSNWKNLSNLEISRCGDVDEKNLAEIAKCQKVYSVTLFADEVSPEGLTHLSKMKSLTRLQAMGCKITLKHMIAFGSMAGLTALSVGTNSLADDASLIPLFSLKNLASLRLGRNSLSPARAAELKELEKQLPKLKVY